jgi:hypothetical protein
MSYFRLGEGSAQNLKCFKSFEEKYTASCPYYEESSLDFDMVLDIDRFNLFAKKERRSDSLKWRFAHFDVDRLEIERDPDSFVLLSDIK